MSRWVVFGAALSVAVSTPVRACPHDCDVAQQDERGCCIKPTPIPAPPSTPAPPPKRARVEPAKPQVTPAQEALARVARGRALLRQNDASAAAEEFQAAYELDASATTTYWLARAYRVDNDQ